VQVLESMEVALRSGAVTGTPNAVNTSTISLDAIAAVAPRLLAPHKAKRIVAMKALTGTVSLLRRAVLAEDWAGVSTQVKAVGLDRGLDSAPVRERFGDTVEVCRQELELIVGEVSPLPYSTHHSPPRSTLQTLQWVLHAP
jgi:hypothetical protein